MKAIFKIIVIALIIPSLALANGKNEKWKHTEKKTYNKEFSVNADATLKISNKFGNLDIQSWSQNKVKIDVLIEVGGNNSEKVKEQLNKISVNFTNTPDLVEAITKMEKQKWKWKKGNKISIKINYTVRVPKSNKVNLSNDYGSIMLDELDGKAAINCDYGKIKIGKLNSSENSINSDYSSGSSIRYIKGGNINADYSGLTIDKADNISINADYTNTTLKSVGTFNYNGDYGNLMVEKGGAINGNGDYTNINIEELTKSLNFNSTYGGVKVNKMGTSVSEVNINTTYAGVYLGNSGGHNFTFDVQTTYADVKLPDNARITTEVKKISKKHYAGYVGSASSG
ncbi:MAG: hypothetical protein HRT68_06425, partial [Flavobacteriaceae bacterium]|nr:hypothetical protein [Flavobacteriaceae bacterium]